MNCIKNERIKNEIIKNERIKNERIKNELIKKRTDPFKDCGSRHLATSRYHRESTGTA